MTVESVLYTFVSSLVALFPLVNPIGNALIVHGSLHGLDERQRKMAAHKIVVNCLTIGLGSLLLGHLVLLLFGLAIPVIQVGGGLVICKTGFDMLSAPDASAVDATPVEGKKVHVSSIESKLFYPLSFPICLGPGSISVIFTLMANFTVKGDWVATGVNIGMIAAAIFVLLMGLYVMLLQGTRLMKRLGESGNMIIGKFIAFITLCIGIQILVTGISKIFHLTIL